VASASKEKFVEQRTQVRVECPQCHRPQFIEAEIDELLLKSPLFADIQSQLEAWLKDRCPDHLGAIAKMSKN